MRLRIRRRAAGKDPRSTKLRRSEQDRPGSVMIWIPIALMTAGAVLAVLWPLSRRGRELGATNDVAVYKDQLEEIERDQNWGLIAPPEADAARVEVSRRLIAAADAAVRSAAPASAASPRRRRVVAVSALVGVPAVAMA